MTWAGPGVALGGVPTPPAPVGRPRRRLVVVALAALLVGACGGGSGSALPAATIGGGASTAAYVDRLDAIETAVRLWASASTIGEAQQGAETAANLVVGPGGPGYGDRDRDGAVGGATGAGLLPSLDGTPVGLAAPLSAVGCVERDVLGGDWTDPRASWAVMAEAIGAWRRDRNTMPSLASHPMRVVGWATFTLASDSLEEAREYAGHAELHVTVARHALSC